jgi:tRNA threonylcarbamoyladenosine biosynthesis protein TsaB
MLVLGIDTALATCSAAVLEDGAVLAAGVLAAEKGHAERLAPLVVEILAAAGVGARDLDRIGVVVGPGGFAGVRVGVAFARGLMLGTKAKAVGATSLEALAAPLRGRCVAAILDARRGDVYAARYDADGGILLAPFVASADDARARLLAAGAQGEAAVGDGLDLVDPQARHFARTGLAAIDPAEVARLAAAAPEPLSPPSPVYLRALDAKPASPSRFSGVFGGGDAD